MFVHKYIHVTTCCFDNGNITPQKFQTNVDCWILKKKSLHIYHCYVSYSSKAFPPWIMHPLLIKESTYIHQQIFKYLLKINNSPCIYSSMCDVCMVIFFKRFFPFLAIIDQNDLSQSKLDATNFVLRAK